MMIYFAPMEGITDGILSRTHQEIFGGVDVYCLPFHKLTHTLSLTTREVRDIAPEENRGLTVLPQALTRDPSQLLEWLKYVAELGYPCADLNLGCPSPTVTKRGRGSGMLRDPEALRAFLDSVFSAPLPIPLSVKTRIGVEDPDEWPAILQVLSRYPFEHVTIHVRTTREQYTGGIHPDAFALALRQGLPHPVYNGDLRCVRDVADLLKACPGTDTVMIGRGLLADPALARQLQGGSPACPDELRTWYTALYRGWEQRFQHTIALGRIKKMAELAGHDDIQQKRLLRRAESIEECIEALTDREE